MIKTLRITTIIAAILAVGFFAFPAVFGFRGDEGIEQFLNSPGAIEKFNKAKGAKPSRTGSQIPPLVKQAVAYGFYLNPPRREPVSRLKAPPPVARKQPTIPDPPRPKVKFKLIGTSYYESRPELSLAYIDEPGKGLYWVKQGSKVAHLLIEQVKDGSIVVKDQEKSVTLVADRPPKRSLIKGENTSKSTPVLPGASASITSSAPVQVSARETVTAVPPRAVPPRASRRPPEMSDAEQDALLADFINELKAQQRGAGAGAEEKASLEEAIANLEAMRVTTGEAKRLDRLGREMRRFQSDPNRAGSSKIGSSKKPQMPPPPPPPPTRKPSSVRRPPLTRRPPR